MKEFYVKADVTVVTYADSEQAAEDKVMEQLGEICLDIAIQSIE